MKDRLIKRLHQLYNYTNELLLQVRTAGDNESSATAMETPATTAGTCEEHDLRMLHQQITHPHQHHQQLPTAAFHINMPSHSISTILSPPVLHHSSATIIPNDESFHLSTIMLQSENVIQVRYYSLKLFRLHIN